MISEDSKTNLWPLTNREAYVHQIINIINAILGAGTTEYLHAKE